jgi:MscS family membrane protein
MLAWLLQNGATDGGSAASEAASGSVEAAGGAADAAQGAAEVADVAEKYDAAAEAIRSSASSILPESVTNYLGGFADAQVLGLSILELIVGVVAFIVVLILRQVVLRVLDRYIKPLAERTEGDYDDKMLAAFRRAVSYIIVLGGLFVFFSIVELPKEPIDLAAGVWRVLNTLIIVIAGLLLYRIVEIGLSFMSKRRDGEGGQLERQIIPLIRDVAKVVILAGVVIAIVQSWGYSAASLLAGLGIGGLALAFAAQDTVANIFGSLVVYSDRPYKVGDWIALSGVEGTVEEIGVRSTRIRTFDKTLVSVPNKVVTNENIQNYSQMNLRRIKLTLGLSYESSPDQMRSVVGDIRQLLADTEGVDQGFWAVNFTDFGASSLDVMVYCFTSTTDWVEYLEIRQGLLLSMMDICERRGVEIAFPTQTLYHKLPDDTGLPAELARDYRPSSPRRSPAPRDPGPPSDPQSRNDPGPRPSA